MTGQRHVEEKFLKISWQIQKLLKNLPVILEEGSLVSAKVVDQNVILISQETVDKEQSWFWQEKWQKLEAGAEEDIRQGRVKSSDSVEELFNEIEEAFKAYQNGKVQKTFLIWMSELEKNFEAR